MRSSHDGLQDLLAGIHLWLDMISMRAQAYTSRMSVGSGSDRQMANTTLITGGSRGIGAAIAERLTHEGHVVINLSRSPPGSDFSGVSHSVDLADAQALKAILA